ncbi:hypothetical protein [Rudanella lutea]|nr:hypothetical protein [Rudanella lutea]
MSRLLTAPAARMLFIKRLDDIQLAKEQKATYTGKPVESPIYQPE